MMATPEARAIRPSAQPRAIADPFSGPVQARHPLAPLEVSCRRSAEAPETPAGKAISFQMGLALFRRDSQTLEQVLLDSLVLSSLGLCPEAQTGAHQ